jgi:serine/threonine protein phosphatase 1
MSRWVIPDIHGCNKTFRKLVNEMIKLKEDDLLITLGDYIDRGPDSKGVLDFLIELKEKTNLVGLIGNHEEFMMLSLNDKNVEKEWNNNGGIATKISFENGIIPDKYYEFISNLSIHGRMDNYIFVHAGLDFTLDDIMKTDSDTKLWVRMGTVIPEKLNGKILITGHTIVDLITIQKNIENKIWIDLDNGCFQGASNQCIANNTGNLLAYNLDTKELLICPYCE